MSRSQSSILIGYFPKRVLPRPEWLKAPNVVEICSVSECMSPGPASWIDFWRHNEMWCFDSPELARSVLSVESADEFRLFAYRMLPMRFDGDAEVEVTFPALATEPIDASFEFLGFDAVGRSTGNTFDCSPLSCNGGAESNRVNQYCLVDDEQEIVRLAREFANPANGWEPGPYFVVEVWRCH